jgi:hypothetical protein
VLVLDMIEILSPLGKYKYDTWKILPVKCDINNYMHLRSCIRNIKTLRVGVRIMLKNDRAGKTWVLDSFPVKRAAGK